MLRIRLINQHFPRRRVLHLLITSKGYTGSLASLRMFMQKEREHAQTQNATGSRTVDFVQRRSLCQIIYKKLEDIPVFSQEQYEEVIRKYPVLGQLYAALKEKVIYIGHIGHKLPTVKYH